MTDNHRYNIPERGANNWATQLNENFKRIDTGVEIRDTESNREEYTPKEGAKFFAVDTGRIYLGDGSDWDSIDLFETKIESFQDALANGYIVGVLNNHQTIVDPTKYDSDAVAIQAANDDLLEKSDRHDVGFVYIPVVDPNGNEIVIDRTVVFGSRTEYFGAFPRGWGFSGRNNKMIQCTIDNGDPMFVVASASEHGNAVSGNASSFGGFAAYADGNDAGFLRLENVQSFNLWNVSATAFDCPTADGVYVLDGACYNSYINNCNYTASRTHCPDADIWVVSNDTGDGPPSEIKWGPGNSTYAAPEIPFNIGYKQETDSSSMVIGGRIEGDGGPAKLYVTDGSVGISGYWESGRSEGPDTDSLFFDGRRLRISPTAEWGSNDTGGHIIHIGGNASRVHIPAMINSSVNGGDVIHFDSGGSGSRRYYVPYENMVNGSVTYPEPKWNATRYHDGWQKFREGTTEIKPNSTTRLEGWAGRTGEEIELRRKSIVSEPDGDCRFQLVHGWGTERERQWIGVKETGGYGFTLEWELHRRASQ